jgi:hypothetical protein
MSDERKVNIDTGADLSPETRAMLEDTVEEKPLRDGPDSSSRKPGMGLGMPLPMPPIPEKADSSSEEADSSNEEKDEAREG